MITTLSRQGGRRYPQMHTPASLVQNLPIGSVATTPTTTTYIVDPSVMYQFFNDGLINATGMQQFFVPFKQSN